MIIRELIAKLKLDGSEFNRNLEKADSALGKLKWGLALAVAGSAALAAGMFKLAESTSEYGDNVAKMAKDVGIATDAYQELAYAANQADVSREQFDQGLKLFARNVGNQAMGKGDVFSKLGVSIRDANGHLRNQKDILYDTADRLKGIHDQSVRAAFGMELFGRSGIRMATFVGDGSEALKAQAVEARRLGLVLSDETLRDAGEFNDGMKRVHATLEGIRNTLGAGLLPWFNKMLEALRKWYLANADIIRQGLTTTLQVLAAALGDVWQLLTDVYYVLDKQAKAWGGWGRALKILGIELAAIWAALNLPLLAAIAIVGLLLLAFDDIVGYFQGKKSVTGLIVNSFNRAFDDVGKRVKKWVDDFLQWISPVTDAIKAVGEFFGSVGHNDGGKAGRGAQTAPQPTARGARGAAVHAAIAQASAPPGTRGASAAGQSNLQRGVSPKATGTALASTQRSQQMAAFQPIAPPRPTIASIARAVSPSPQQMGFQTPQAFMQRHAKSAPSSVTHIDRRSVVVTHNGGFNFNMPAGSTEQQVKSFADKMRKVAQEVWGEEIRRTMGDHPSYGGN